MTRTNQQSVETSGDEAVSASDHDLAGNKSLVRLDSHGDAFSIQALGYVLRSMRWDDLEAFAAELDNARAQGRKESSARLTAAHINTWAST